MQVNVWTLVWELSSQWDETAFWPKRLLGEYECEGNRILAAIVWVDPEYV